MPDVVRLLDPHKIKRNPENPRLIFHQDELEALQESIAQQGILVPLTTFQDGSEFFLLDGERRWRCAIKLGLSKVPVVVQPKPDRLQNIMMMFGIHKVRKDWDPLPTALKLEDLEKEFAKRNGRRPTETELTGIASLSRGEVRRLKKLLQLPSELKSELMAELRKPRSQQELTVDQVLEATKGSEALRKRSIIDEVREAELRKALIHKFRKGIIKSTVDPRKLVKLSRAVVRNEISSETASKAVSKLIDDPSYSIDAAFEETVEQVEFQHNLEQLADRILTRLEDHRERKYRLSVSLREKLRRLASELEALLRL